jgi:hypothetical protein
MFVILIKKILQIEINLKRMKVKLKEIFKGILNFFFLLKVSFNIKKKSILTAWHNREITYHVQSMGRN